MEGAVDAERAAGARLQVNASSLTGRHGAERAGVGDRAAPLRPRRRDRLRRAPPTRPPQLSAALDVLAAHGVPRADAEPLVGAAPRALLAHGIAPARRAAPPDAAPQPGRQSPMRRRDDHPVPRRPAARPRPVPAARPGRQRDRRRPRDRRAVPLRQVAPAAVLRRHAQARALQGAERRERAAKPEGRR